MVSFAMKDTQNGLLLGAGYERDTARLEAADRVAKDARTLRKTIEAKGPKHDGIKVRALKRTEETADGFGQRRIAIDGSGMSYRIDTGTTSVRVGHQLLDVWAQRLIAHGRRLDDQLDELLSELIAYDFKAWTDARPIEASLGSVLVRREDIRAYEREVEEHLHDISVTTGASFDVLPVTQMLSQLQRTYDLATFKITSISSTRSTYASLVVAVVALGIAFAGLLLGS